MKRAVCFLSLLCLSYCIYGSNIDRSIYFYEISQGSFSTVDRYCTLTFYDNNEYTLELNSTDLYPNSILAALDAEKMDDIIETTFLSIGTYSIKDSLVMMHDKIRDIEMLFEQTNDTTLVARKAFHFLIGKPFIYSHTYPKEHVMDDWLRDYASASHEEIAKKMASDYKKVTLDYDEELQFVNNRNYEFSLKLTRLYLYNKVRNFKVTYDGQCLFKGSVKFMYKKHTPYRYLALTDSVTGYTSYAFPNGPYLESDNLTGPDDGICLYREVLPEPVVMPTEEPFRRFIRRIKDWLRRIFC